jgi:hypothetical protein
MPTGPHNDRRRRLLVIAALYLGLLVVYALVAGEARLTEHTPFNHFALLAEGWLKGRLDLGRSPPAYAQGNDFALYHGKWFVTFPAFPAFLLLPLVALAGSAERVRDAQFFVWLAPIAPVVLFMALEKLRRSGLGERTSWQNLLLALSFALGSVYFFTAVQGTVWFAAHVVAAGLGAAFLYWSIAVSSPTHAWLAGFVLGLGFWTRPQLLFAVPLFTYEVWRQCRATPSEGAASEPLRWAWLRGVDWRRFVQLHVAFALPLLLLLLLAAWHNWLRFDAPLDFGYRHLQVAWQGRIEEWGLWHYHYLAKNLGVVLTSMPWVKPFQINAHGLALWLTTPAYLWLVWPKPEPRGLRQRGLFVALLVTALGVALPGLLYQNTGWLQFGYRFSNDYAVFLFAALALCGRRFGWLFWTALLWALCVNTFGAITFEREAFQKLYFQENSQRVIYQPD